MGLTYLCCLQVFAIVFKLGQHVVPGPTQILSDASCSCDPNAVLDSLDSAMAGRVPKKPSEAKVDGKTFEFKEYRVKTKNLLSAVANSIQQLDENFKLNHTRPEHSLLPCGRKYLRERMLPEEMQVWAGSEVDLSCMGQRFFLYDPEKGTSRPDWYIDEKFVRFCMSSDEGTEALVFQDLVSLGLQNRF